MDEPVIVATDLGNSLEKGVSYNPKTGATKRHVMPHALIRETDPVIFRAAAARAAGMAGNGDPEYFAIHKLPPMYYEFGDHKPTPDELFTGYFVAGKSAESAGVVKRLTGSAKYSRPYMGALLVGLLLELLPDGHDNIDLWIAFPSGDSDYVKYLTESVLGTFKVETVTGRELKYVIRKVHPVEEAIGGARNLYADDTGARRASNQIEKGKTLWIDVGGQISTIVYIDPDFRVLYPTSRSIAMGVQNVEHTFWAELRRIHAAMFVTMRSLPPDMMREGLSTGFITVKNQPIDVNAARNSALNAFVNQFSTVLSADFANGTQANQIGFSGGGSAILFPILTRYLDHDRAFLADRADEIHMANVNGIMKMARAAHHLKG